MRDPTRIPIVLEEIRKLWEHYPDWRLGQLIVNATGRNDPFYTEDDMLVAHLQQLNREIQDE